MVNFTQKIIVFFRTCILMLSVDPSAVLGDMGAQTLVPPKMIFLYIHAKFAL